MAQIRGQGFAVNTLIHFQVLKKERQRNRPAEPMLHPASDAAATEPNDLDLQSSKSGSNAAVTEIQTRAHTKQALDTAAKENERTRNGSSRDASFVCSYHPGQVANRVSILSFILLLTYRCTEYLHVR